MGLNTFHKPDDFMNLTNEDFNYLNAIQNVSQRLKAMVSILQLSEQDLKERNNIRNKIYSILREFYPDCEIVIFGSSVNGYGFKDCDLDILFLPFPGYCNIDFKHCEPSSIPTLYKINQGKFPIDELLQMNEESHLKFIQKTLYTRRELFHRITFIPARCPILNIDMYFTDIHCDLSASNRLVAANSELLWLFGKMDFRVKPLIFALRYWAKSLGFIKKSLLSSYAFTLLVIFALQNTQPPVLPSVKSLIQKSGQKIDGWETSFIKNLQHIPQSTNSLSIEELLVHFFDFYWNFDFVNNIVCPYTGSPLHIQSLKNAKDERLKSFTITSFSIQDPFIRNFNISRNAAMKTSFKIALLIAKEFLQSRNFQDFFNLDLYKEKIKLVYANFSHQFSNDSLNCFLHLNYNICNSLGLTKKDLYYIWYDKASQAVFDTLQHGLLMFCEVTDNTIWTPPKKKRKLSKRSIIDTVGNLQLIMSIQCFVYFETWVARKKVTNVDMENGESEFPEVLRREHNISMKLASNFQEVLRELPMLWLTCNIYKYPFAEIPVIVITFSSHTDATLDGLIMFLKSFIPKTVEKILCESNCKKE